MTEDMPNFPPPPDRVDWAYGIALALVILLCGTAVIVAAVCQHYPPAPATQPAVVTL